MDCRRCALLLAGPLCLVPFIAGCSGGQSSDTPNGHLAPVRSPDTLADAPEDFAAFLKWAGGKLETELQPVPIPTSPDMPPPCWPVLRLADAALFSTSRTQSDWIASPSQSGALAEVGPFRSDQPGPMFFPQRMPKDSPSGKDSLALMMGGFQIRCEDVGSIELTLEVPYGDHVTLSWSWLGSVIIPVESHEKPFTVRVATTGFAEWSGTRDKIAIITDGLGDGVVRIDSLRFLPRQHSYPQPSGVQRVRLDREIRDTIYSHCPGEIRYEDVTLPQDARLDVGLAQAAGTLPQRPSASPARARFEVLITHDGVQTTVLDQELTVTDAWLDVSAPLKPWSGQRVMLTLKCTSNSPDAVVFWGNPTIYGPVDDPPLLVIYLIDTVASQHTELYGYNRETMPRLSAIAERGAWFSQMFSNASRTIESIPDLMLSMPVERHGVYHSSTPAPQGLVTLAETLQAAGFATASFCTNVNAGPRQGMDQGFETFVDRIGSQYSHVDRTIPLEEVLAWIGHHRARPMFMYIHTAEPHSPYTPPEGFRNRFDPGYRGPFTGVDFYAARDPRDLAHIRALYDEEIVYADARLGMFLDALQERGLLDKAHFFVTSDHGEEFLEHFHWEHGRDLHSESTRVPLIAFGPTFTARGEVDVPVQSFDVMPTILEMFNLPAPYALEGTSLLPLLRAPADAAASRTASTPLDGREIFASNHNYRIESHRLEYSIIKNGRWKLVFGAEGVPMSRGGPKSRFTLFDLDADPRERRNLVAAYPKIVRRLAEDLIRWRLSQHPYAAGTRGPTLIDAEHMRELEALGYVGDDHSADAREDVPGTEGPSAP